MRRGAATRGAEASPDGGSPEEDAARTPSLSPAAGHVRASRAPSPPIPSLIGPALRPAGCRTSFSGARV